MKNQLKNAQIRIALRCCRKVVGHSPNGKPIHCFNRMRVRKGRTIRCLSGHIQRGDFRKLLNSPQWA